MVSWALELESSLRFLRNRKTVDIFPCTVRVDLFPYTDDINGIVSRHVETVVLMSRVKD